MRAVLVLLALATACGPGSYGDFREQLVHSSCTWAVKCGLAGAGERSTCPTEQVLALLHDSAIDRAAPGAIDLEGSIAAGRLGFDSLDAQSCLDAVSGSPCDPVLAARKQARICDVVYAPRTTPGEACWSDLECEGGTCVHDLGCAGTCVAYAAFGAQCTTGVGCDPTVAYCDGTCQHKQPQGGKCTTDVQCAIGYPCSDGHCNDPVTIAEGAPCGTDPCKQGTYCDPGTNVCTKHSARNAACDGALACADGLACVGLVAGGQGTCKEWLAAGDPCVDVGVTGCPASQTCSDGVCTLGSTPAYVQERCTDRSCANGLGCNTIEVCDWLRPLFGDCSGESSMLCEPGLSCSMFGQDLGVEPGRCIPVDAQACFAPSPNDGGLEQSIND